MKKNKNKVTAIGPPYYNHIIEGV